MNRIKLKRMEKQMTQLELAQKVGCSERHISRFETGRSKIDPYKLTVLAKALGCEAKELL